MSRGEKRKGGGDNGFEDFVSEQFLNGPRKVNNINILSTWNVGWLHGSKNF